MLGSESGIRDSVRRKIRLLGGTFGENIKVDGDRWFLMTGGIGAGRMAQGTGKRLTRVAPSKGAASFNLSPTGQRTCIAQTQREISEVLQWVEGRGEVPEQSGSVDKILDSKAIKKSLTFHSKVTPQVGRLGYQF